MPDDSDISIGGDASGNVIIQGTNNRARVVIIQQRERIAELVEAKPEPARGVFINPYRSLLAFTESDADLYFGRETQTADLYQRFERLQRPGAVRLLPVLGPSGSGKSSLARAGLIPELARQPLPALLTPRVAVLTPGSHPLEALATVLARIATNDLTPVAKTREFAEELVRAAPDGAYDGLRRIADVLPSIETQRLVVLVDQFEETFSLAPAKAADNKPLTVQDDPERRAFIGNLLTAAADPSGRVTVVLTFRSDFLGAIQAFPELSRQVSAQGYIVPAMTRADLTRAVAEPARKAGRPLEPDTVELLVDQTVGREGALPLLQFALTRIWEAREREGKEPADTLRELGGVGGALASFAHELYAGLPEREQRIARRALLKMVQLGEGAADTRRRASLAEMVAQGETPDDVLAVLRRFAAFDRRLITLEGDHAEVTHEALIGQWKDLKDWLDTSRVDERYHRQLAEDVDEWDSSSRPKGSLYQPPRLDLLRAFVGRRRSEMRDVELQFYDTSENAWRARGRWRVAGIAAAIAFALILAGIGFRVASQQQAAAERQKQLTEEARRHQADAEAQRAAALATTGRLLGTEAQRRLAQPITQETSPLIAALATVGWRLGKTSDAWNAMQRVPLVATLARINHDSGVVAVAFSPDSKLLATASYDKTARLVAVADGRELARINEEYYVRAIAFSPDGRLLATASGDRADQRSEGQVRIVAVADGRELARIVHDNDMNAVAFSPDGKYLATASFDKTARLVAIGDGREVARIAHEGEVQAVAFSPDGKYLATASFDKTARLVAVADGREVARIAHEGEVQAVAFSPDGKYLATASFDKTARLVAVADGREVARIAHEVSVRAVAFSPDGTRLTTASGDNVGNNGEARLVAVADGRELARIAHEGSVVAVAFSPDSKLLATASNDMTARLVTVADGREFARITHKVETGMVRAVAFSPDGRYLATASGDRTAQIVAIGGGRELVSITPNGSVRAVALSPDGQLLATASNDKTARLVAIGDGREVARIAHEGEVQAVAFSPDGQLLALATISNAEGTKGNRIPRLVTRNGVPRFVVGNGLVRLVAIGDGREVARIAHEGEVQAVAFSPDSKLLAITSKDYLGREGEARIVSVADGREVAYEGEVQAVAFSPDSKLLAVTSKDYLGREGEARIVSVADGREVARIAHEGEVQAVAFSPDGQLLATASNDNTARLVAVADGREVARIAHEGSIYVVAFSPDGQLLATASFDKTARLVAVADGREVARIAHDSSVWAVAFSPDGRLLATASGDFPGGKGEARLVAVADGRELARITHDHLINAVTFSPNGAYLTTWSPDWASGGTGGGVQLWSTNLDDMLDRLCAGLGRNLSPGEWRRHLGDLPLQLTCETWPTPPG